LLKLRDTTSSLSREACFLGLKKLVCFDMISVMPVGEVESDFLESSQQTSDGAGSNSEILRVPA